VRAYRRIFDELEPPNETRSRRSSRIYQQTRSWTELEKVYERELENALGRRAGGGDPRAHGAPRRRRLGNKARPIEGWKRVLDLRGEDPEALRALAGLYEEQGSWAELTDVLERHFDIAESDEDRVAVLVRARVCSPSSSNATTKRSRRGSACSTSTSRTSRRCAPSRTSGARARIRRSSWRACTRRSIARGAARADGAQGSLPRARADLRRVLEQPFEAAEAWRHLLDVDRPTSRRWRSSRRSTAPTSAGPRWSA
jgi:hypothetical protein